MTTFLKFPSESDFINALSELGITPAAEIMSDKFVLSVIGLIPEVEGFHVNLLGEIPEDWGAMVVQVNSPVRVFG